MPAPIRLRVLLLLFVFWLVLGSHGADANCSAFDALPEFYVGNKASDAACTYDTIQAAITAATCAYGTNIFITDELGYTAQHLSIAGKKLNLIGRAPGLHCGYIGPGARPEQATSDPIIPRETISGAGGAYLPTVTITGASKITLINLEIRDGHGPNDGGGISYTGTGTLQLNNVLVENNIGGNGGGIAVTAQGGIVTVNLNSGTHIVSNIGQLSGGGIFMNGLSTSDKSYLMLNSGVQIDSNTAQQSGGGLRIEGMAGLYTQFNVQIAGNMAPNGYGGGIDFVAPAFAQFYPAPLLQGNTAQDGGGMAIRGSGTFLQGLVDIANNTATRNGGGVYVQGGYTSLAIGDISNNVAVDGSAIYADAGSGGYLNLGGEAVAYNVNRDANNFPTAGSTIVINGGDFFPVSADDLRLHNNYGGHLLHAIGDFTILNSLLVDNVITTELVLNERGGNVGANWKFCTVAHN